MGLDIVVAKIAFAFVFAVILIYVIRPAISVIGIVTCPNCSGFLNAFFFVAIPIGITFIGLYHVFGVFTRRT